jgi:hypothetical protein
MTLIIGTGSAIAWCASTIHCLVVDITLRHSKGCWHMVLWMLMSQLKWLRKTVQGPLWLFVLPHTCHLSSVEFLVGCWFR